MCVWQCVQSFSIGAFSLCVCFFPDTCVCCKCPKRTSCGYLLPRHPIREQCVPEARKRSQICTLYDTHALVSPCVTATKRPLTESRHLPNMPPPGISRHTHTGNIHKEKLEAHNHTDTPKGKEERKDTVMSERDTQRS